MDTKTETIATAEKVEEPVQVPTRDGFGLGLLELGAQNPNVVVLTGDLARINQGFGFEKEISGAFCGNWCG